jgi:hypothetical protein
MRKENAMAKRKLLIVIPVGWLALSLACAAAADEYRLVAKHSGKCLNVAGGHATNKTPVVQWECNAGNDNFVLKDLGNGWNNISPGYATNMCLDIDWNRRNDNGVHLVIFECWVGENQMFQLQPAGGDAYRIVNRASGKCLDVEGEEKGAGAAIHQWECKSFWNDHQLFYKVLSKRTSQATPSPPPPRPAPSAPLPKPPEVPLAKKPLDAVFVGDGGVVLPGDFLLGNTGAALVGNAGSGLVGNAGSGLVNNSGGALIGNTGAAFATQSLGGLQVQSAGGKIEEAFRRALGRSPTVEELAAWQQRGKLLSDEGFVRLIMDPKAGPLRERLVEAAFRTGTRRAPRPGEVAELARALQVSGRLYDQVVPALGIVENSYRAAFNRMPEIGELSSWLSLAPSDSRLASRDALLASLRAFLRNPAPAAVEMRKALVSSAYKSVRPGASLAPQEMDWWIGAVRHYGWLYGEVAYEMRKKFAPPPVQSTPKGRGGRRTNAVGG